MIPLTLEELRARATHPRSRNLPPNPHQQSSDFLVYAAVLAQYCSPRVRGERSDHCVPNRENPNRNIGWKFHLNVPVAHVRRVSGYLLDEQYNHKFLSGGDIDNGKIFTIYIGSRARAEQETGKISIDIGELLARPVNADEAEFAPGIVGRFTDNQTRRGGIEFILYGTAGIVYLKAAAPMQRRNMLRNTKQSEEISFNALAALHRSYFTG